ncbi:transporter substrate-binding domain-containing protein [Massilia sp. MB5]|uniref:substrate-binding periplasmic protein n=1 Tax=unclassified Massilia TaxID=2609279 RepID=UPI00067AC762|nr:MULTISPECIES: transporter substrate-binding domain-containing protein [unclassified Massilia]AKU22698.1 hypothetical protein ACZ75_15735 [Massilia sp. NR 4-1]UMR32495.1 transporter substrate-binding domain-containing protein [Massilia sp. MB5]
MRARRRYLLVLTSLALLAGLPARAAPPPLTFCFEDVAQRPWTTPKGKGLNFELLQRVEKQLGEQFVYAPKPWRRCLEEIRSGRVDGVIAAADSPARRRLGQFPLLPDGRSDPARALNEDHAYVYLRIGGQGRWDGQTLYSPNGEIAVQTGYMIATVLRERGYKPRELVKSADDALRLLVSGMFDVAVLQGSEASRLALQDPRFRERVQQAMPPYATLVFHLIFSHQAYERDPARAEAIWREMGAVRQSHEYRQLLKEAGVGN